MKSRLVSRLPGTMDPGFFAQLLENIFGSIASDPLKLYCSQHWCVLCVMDRWPLLIDIGFQDAPQVRSNGNEAALKELGLANSEHPRIAIKIFKIQPQRFTDPEAGSIK